MSSPIMPKATAVWLVDNTALTFDQIADFCGLHALEVQGIADGEVAQGIQGFDPIANGQLTRDEIKRCEADPGARLMLIKQETTVNRRGGGPRYTPVSRRQDKPDAIAWLLRHHPELSDAQICRLVGTTKPTINAVRERTHWNMSNIRPVDPVALSLCTQVELDTAVSKAAKKLAKQENRPEEAAATSTIDEVRVLTAEEVAAQAEAREAQAQAFVDVFGGSPE